MISCAIENCIYNQTRYCIREDHQGRAPRLVHSGQVCTSAKLYETQKPSTY